MSNLPITVMPSLAWSGTERIALAACARASLNVRGAGGAMSVALRNPKVPSTP